MDKSLSNEKETFIPQNISSYEDLVKAAYYYTGEDILKEVTLSRPHHVPFYRSSYYTSIIKSEQKIPYCSSLEYYWYQILKNQEKCTLKYLHVYSLAEDLSNAYYTESCYILYKNKGIESGIAIIDNKLTVVVPETLIVVDCNTNFLMLSSKPGMDTIRTSLAFIGNRLYNPINSNKCLHNLDTAIAQYKRLLQKEIIWTEENGIEEQ